MTETVVLEPIKKLAKDLKVAAANLTVDEARFLVHSYYAMQGDRIRDRHQQRQLLSNDEPATVLDYLGNQHEVLEKEIGKALDVYSASKPIGQWMRSIVGIGPVISAGFIAHIDIVRSETASQLWSFAGLNPTVVWSKGQKRPWNADLKVLCWKLGESFVKTCNHEDSFYGPIYQKRKAVYAARNEAGEYAERAAKILAGETNKRAPGKTTEAYGHLTKGKLPPAQIHAMARRYTVKLFISHLHETWRKMEGLPVREPYMVAVGKLTGAPHEKIEPPPIK